MLTANLLDDKMKALAEMLAHHHQRMSIAYEIDYTADANDVPRGLEVDLTRTDLKVQISVRRPL